MRVRVEVRVRVRGQGEWVSVLKIYFTAQPCRGVAYYLMLTCLLYTALLDPHPFGNLR